MLTLGSSFLLQYCCFHFCSLCAPRARTLAGGVRVEQAKTGVSVGSCLGISLASGVQALSACSEAAFKTRRRSISLVFLA